MSKFAHAPIIIEFAGGVGNQLFQYAFYQYLIHNLALAEEQKILFDITAVQRDIKRDLIIAKLGIDNKKFIKSRRELFKLLGVRINTSLSRKEKIINKIFPYQLPQEATEFLLIDDDILSKKYLSNVSSEELLYKQYMDIGTNIHMEHYAEEIIMRINAHIKSKKNEAVYIRGYWQYAYFNQQNIFHSQYSESIDTEGFLYALSQYHTLQYKKNISISSEEAYRKIIGQGVNTCSLHIRRSDYLLATVQSALPPLSMDYYKHAVEKIISIYPKTEFYIFSDDPQWCNTHIDFIKHMHIASSRLSFNEIEDLVLMNACTHHILANSSFSWWGSMMPNILFTDTNEAKKPYIKESMTIAPKLWFRDKVKNQCIKNTHWLEL